MIRLKEPGDVPRHNLIDKFIDLIDQIIDENHQTPEEDPSLDRNPEFHDTIETYPESADTRNTGMNLDEPFETKTPDPEEACPADSSPSADPLEIDEISANQELLVMENSMADDLAKSGALANCGALAKCDASEYGYALAETALAQIDTLVEQTPETPAPGLGLDPAFLRETGAGILKWATKIEYNLLLLATSPGDPALILTLFDEFLIINRLACLAAADPIRNLARRAGVLLKKYAGDKEPIPRSQFDWLAQSNEYIQKLEAGFEITEDPEFIAAVAAHLHRFPARDEELAEIDNEIFEGARVPIPKLGEILIEQKKLTPAEVAELLAKQKNEAPELRLGQIALRDGRIDPEALREALKIQLKKIINHTPKSPETGPETKEGPFAQFRKVYGLEKPLVEPVKKDGATPAASSVISQDELDRLLEEYRENQPDWEPDRAAEAAEQAEPGELIQPIPAREHEFKTVSAGNDNVRISITKVDNLVDMVGELLIIQSLLEQEAGKRFDSNDYLMNNLLRMARVTKDIQNMSMSLRMISLKSTFQKINRVARDTITRLGKNISFQMSGEETEIDRGMAEKILEPLIYLVKNAISQGIEPESDRISRKKPAQGQVKVEASSKRGHIFIDVSDDGTGMEVDLEPVKTQMQKVGGKVEINNRPGQGSIFTLKIPINFAVFNGIIISIEERTFIIPTQNVRRIVQIKPDQWVVGNGKKMISIRDKAYPVIPIFNVLGLKSQDTATLVVILELDQNVKALPVHGIVGKREIVLKPLGNEFSELAWIAGASILGDGKVSLILDIENIFKLESGK